MSNYIFQCLTIVFTWIIGYFLTIRIGNGLSAIQSYALVSGWWFCAYVSSKLSISVKAAVISAVAYFTLFVFAAMTNQNIFYSDIKDAGFFGVLSLGILQALVFSSPVLFNSIVSLGLRKIGYLR